MSNMSPGDTSSSGSDLGNRARRWHALGERVSRRRIREGRWNARASLDPVLCTDRDIGTYARDGTVLVRNSPLGNHPVRTRSSRSVRPDTSTPTTRRRHYGSATFSTRSYPRRYGYSPLSVPQQTLSATRRIRGTGTRSTGGANLYAYAGSLGACREGRSLRKAGWSEAVRTRDGRLDTKRGVWLLVVPPAAPAYREGAMLWEL